MNRDSLDSSRRTSILLSLPLVLFLALQAVAVPTDAPALEAMRSITEHELRAEVHFLASDEMEGRDSLSNELVSRYLAYRFERMGLEPVDGSYFQDFNLVRSELKDGNRLQIRPRQGKPFSASLKQEFYPAIGSAAGKVRGRVVFAGYGITSTENRYDDYEGLDVTGAVVLVMSQRPPASEENGDFPPELAHPEQKVRNAKERGAAAVLLTAEPAASGNENFGDRALTVWPKNRSHGRLSLEVGGRWTSLPVLWISNKTADLLLKESLSSLDAVHQSMRESRQPRSMEIPGTEISLEVATNGQRFQLRNVLAMVPGSDPELRDEVVVIGAHFDHIGTRGDDVFNGADDNASGVAGLLEVAEAFALNRERPRRTVIFAGWNAEERGLLGSTYYVQRPPLPLRNTIAKIQMDMIGRDEEIDGSRRFRGFEPQKAEENSNAVNVLGYSYSEDLKNLVSGLNRTIGLDVRFRYDDHPQNLIRRSDHWPFLSSQVPSLFFNTGLHPDYHMPTDTADKINYPKMERIARLVFLTAWSLANTDEPPRLDR
jgi:hypothetical protein